MSMNGSHEGLYYKRVELQMYNQQWVLCQQFETIKIKIEYCGK